MSGTTLANVHPHSVFENDTAGWAAEQMGKYQVEQLVVRKSYQDPSITGCLSAGDLLAYYSSEKQRQTQRESPRRTRRMLMLGRKMVRRMD